MTNEEPEKVDLRSFDVAEEKRRELLRLFPEIRTEGGKIDFDRLKLTLGEMVDVGRERYGMNWPGKADCFRTIQAPSVATLRPCREESATASRCRRISNTPARLTPEARSSARILRQTAASTRSG